MKSLEQLPEEEVQDSKICDKPFTVFDSFSHPFLPCQCLFTFCVDWRINLRTASQNQNVT
jgi:hypothetical protein